MHRLLQRQLKQTIGTADVPPQWDRLLSAIDEAYTAADTDRLLIERAMELSSQELLERNRELSRRNAELSAVRETALDCIISMSADGLVTEFNPAAEKTFGYRREEIVGQSMANFLIPERMREKHREGLRQFCRSGVGRVVGRRVEVTARRADGSEFPAEMAITAVHVAGQMSFTAYLRDITRRKLHEQLEQDRTHVLEMVAQGCPLSESLEQIVVMLERQRPGMRAVVFLERDGRLSCAAAPNLPRLLIEKLTGLSIIRDGTISGAAIRAGQTVICTDIATDVRGESIRHAAIASGIRAVWSAPVRNGAGDVIGALTTCFPEPREPQADDLNLVETLARLTALAIEHSRLTERLAHQARHDPLTGLPNRMLLEDRLRTALHAAQRSGESLGVFFIDLDGFKFINDTLGHHCGDLLLKQLAKRLEAMTRQADTLARMGGDEFTLVSPQLGSRNDASHVARRLLDAVRAPFQLGGRELCVSASIGIALYPHDGHDSASLQRNADAAMYRAKSAGRNSFEFFNPYMNAAALERLELESQLRYALERDELVLHYQPQVDCRGEIMGLEALLRWSHPRLGLVSPARFVPLAEESGLIVPIGAWVLHEALLKARQWSELVRRPLRMAVNVSPHQFAHPDFLPMIANEMLRSGVEPQCIELEVTETLLMTNALDAPQKLSQVRQLGVGVAIDDFGTGYSSLAYLHRLPIDTLKIDRSFVQEIGVRSSPRDARSRVAVIRAITSLAGSLNLKTVAEGVETHVQHRMLRRMGCQAMQGYLFSPPIPAKQVPEVLTRNLLSSHTSRRSA